MGSVGGLRAFARLGMAGAAALLAGCSQVAPPKPTVGDHVVAGLEAAFHRQIAAFEAAAKAGRAAPGDPNAAREVFKTGVGVADLSCGLFFRRLGLAQQELDISRRQVALTGASTAAILGIAEASANAIALTATAFGFASSTLENVENVYVFSPEVSSVQALVKSAQSSFLSTTDDDAPDDFTDALRLVADFAQLCEVHTIRRLVNESLSSATPIPVAGGPGDPAGRATAAAQRASLAATLGEATLGGDEVFYLYWLAYGSPDETVRAYLAGKLRNLPEVVRPDGTIAPDLPMRELRRALAPIADRERARFDARIERELPAAQGRAAAVQPPQDAGGTPGQAPPAAAPMAVPDTGPRPGVTIRVR